MDSFTRVLETDATCSARIATINDKLDKVEAQVSADCQNVLKANRDFDYYEEDKPKLCAVTGFSLRNADTDTLAIANFDQATDKSFCKSSFAFNIEAFTDSCVDTVQLDMTGPKRFFEDKTEFAAPYFLLGNSSKMVSARKWKLHVHVVGLSR